MPFGTTPNAARADAFPTEPVGRRTGIGDDAMRQTVGRTLQQQFGHSLAGVDFPAPGNPDWDTGERRARHAEHVRIEVRCHDGGNAVASTPRGVVIDLPPRARPSEVVKGKLDERGGPRPRGVEPWAIRCETERVYREEVFIQAAHQMDHLTLGSTRIEGRHPDRDWYGGRWHAPPFSKQRTGWTLYGHHTHIAHPAGVRHSRQSRMS